MRKGIPEKNHRARARFPERWRRKPALPSRGWDGEGCASAVPQGIVTVGSVTLSEVRNKKAADRRPCFPDATRNKYITE